MDAMRVAFHGVFCEYFVGERNDFFGKTEWDESMVGRNVMLKRKESCFFGSCEGLFPGFVVRIFCKREMTFENGVGCSCV